MDFIIYNLCVFNLKKKTDLKYIYTVQFYSFFFQSILFLSPVNTTGIQTIINTNYAHSSVAYLSRQVNATGESDTKLSRDTIHQIS